MIRKVERKKESEEKRERESWNRKEKIRARKGPEV